MRICFPPKTKSGRLPNQKEARAHAVDACRPARACAVWTHARRSRHAQAAAARRRVRGAARAPLSGKLCPARSADPLPAGAAARGWTGPRAPSLLVCPRGMHPPCLFMPPLQCGAQRPPPFGAHAGGRPRPRRLPVASFVLRSAALRFRAAPSWSAARGPAGAPAGATWQRRLSLGQTRHAPMLPFQTPDVQAWPVRAPVYPPPFPYRRPRFRAHPRAAESGMAGACELQRLHTRPAAGTEGWAVVRPGRGSRARRRGACGPVGAWSAAAAVRVFFPDKFSLAFSNGWGAATYTAFKPEGGTTRERAAPPPTQVGREGPGRGDARSRSWGPLRGWGGKAQRRSRPHIKGSSALQVSVGIQWARLALGYGKAPDLADDARRRQTFLGVGEGRRRAARRGAAGVRAVHTRARARTRARRRRRPVGPCARHRVRGRKHTRSDSTRGSHPRQRRRRRRRYMF
ncbi:MAG: hypothetical protein J3K34DRAFT_21340 [Monoraphidium minutum]|nr:MAG: hypothetical protein J3K34DRAFT_21340 [Monoraphidium minutum]